MFAGIGTFQNRTHTRGPTTGPQVRSARHSSSRRILLSSTGPPWASGPRHAPPIQRRFETEFITAGPQRARKSLPRATNPAAEFFFSSEVPPIQLPRFSFLLRTHRRPTGLQRVQPMEPPHSSFLRRGPQTFPVWGKSMVLRICCLSPSWSWALHRLPLCGTKPKP